MTCQVIKKISCICLLALGCSLGVHCGTANAEPVPAANDGVRHYTADRGDTFGIISRRVGYPAELLAAMNDLSPGYCCKGGEELLLPTPTQTVSTARSGGIRSSTGGAVWQAPLSGEVTSAFASVRSTSRHHGTDIAAESGTPIAAVHGGTVLEAGWKNSIYGYAVLLDHGNGWQTMYAHCSDVLVQPGQQVRLGQTIALVGSTGNSTGPHLHLELKKDGVFLDPTDIISGIT